MRNFGITCTVLAAVLGLLGTYEYLTAEKDGLGVAFAEVIWFFAAPLAALGVAVGAGNRLRIYFKSQRSNIP